MLDQNGQEVYLDQNGNPLDPRLWTQQFQGAYNVGQHDQGQAQAQAQDTTQPQSPTAIGDGTVPDTGRPPGVASPNPADQPPPPAQPLPPPGTIGDPNTMGGATRPNGVQPLPVPGGGHGVDDVSPRQFIDQNQTFPPAGTGPAPASGAAQPPPPPASAVDPASLYPGAISGNSGYQFDPNVDYSKDGAIYWDQFQKNAYAQHNAETLPLELDPNTALKGGLNEQNLKALIAQYGYTVGKLGYTSDQYNQALNDLYSAGAKNPSVDFYLVPQSDGGFGILARERTIEGQNKQGFIAPWQAAAKAEEAAKAAAASQAARGGGGGGGGGGRGPAPRQAAAPPRPVSRVQGGGGNGSAAAAHAPTPLQTIYGPGGEPINAAGLNPQTTSAAHPNPNAQVNTDHPVEGQVIMYQGRLVQWHNGTWVPYGGSSTPTAKMG